MKFKYLIKRNTTSRSFILHSPDPEVKVLVGGTELVMVRDEVKEHIRVTLISELSVSRCPKSVPVLTSHCVAMLDQ